jgi:hypothetical protein
MEYLSVQNNYFHPFYPSIQSSESAFIPSTKLSWNFPNPPQLHLLHGIEATLRHFPSWKCPPANHHCSFSVKGGGIFYIFGIFLDGNHNEWIILNGFLFFQSHSIHREHGPFIFWFWIPGGSTQNLQNCSGHIHPRRCDQINNWCLRHLHLKLSFGCTRNCPF